MYRIILALVLVSCFAACASGQKKEQRRTENSALVVKEILRIPEGLPRNLLKDAKCVVVIPSVLKFAFTFGGSYGRGVMTCRQGEHFTGTWGPPSMIALEGGSFGFQAGGQATDFVLLLMNARAASAILSSKVKLGVDAAASGGPVGRNAEASMDASLRAQILSYSRSRGVFAGASLSGSTLRADNRANEKLYGKKVNARQVVLKGSVPPPPAAHELLAALNEGTSEKAAT